MSRSSSPHLVILKLSEIMGIPLRPYFLISLLQIFCFSVISVRSQCLEDQQSLLLQLKSSLDFIPSFSTKLVQWNESTKTECCHWAGVTCDSTGHVIGLDLNNESIAGGLDISSSLFQLKYLQSLNLASNFFNYLRIPSGFSRLTTLTYLNLSDCHFAGEIPVELTSLTRLVTLDLSGLDYPSLESPYFADLTVQIPNLSTLLRNLTRLTALYLDGVNISANAYDWCQVISSSLPNLKELSLRGCLLSGPLDSSLQKLQFLSVFQLSNNNLSTPVPDFFADFSNLRVLNLSYSNLLGEFPKRVVKVPNLTTLDLSNNGYLGGSLQEFPENGSLQTMLLSNTNFSGRLGSSVGNLGKLERIELENCSFIGPIPNALANLTQLVHLDLSSNMFTGPLPLFPMSDNLVHIDLSGNSLSGPIPSNQFEGLLNLVSIDLRYNAFNGSIPSSLFALSSLQKFHLSNNHFDGLLSEFSNASSSQLGTLDFRSNNLKGPIPPSFLKLKRLRVLSLSFNNLNGTVELQSLAAMRSLLHLDLSYNNLSVEVGNNNSNSPLLPNIVHLYLASCNLESFPNLKNPTSLVELDLSANRIGGAIPNWILGNGNSLLNYLNLSHNSLVNLQEPYDIPYNLAVLDLHANQLSGKIPLLPPFAVYVDYSANLFNSSLPIDIGNNLTGTYFFSVSNNMLSGTIPDSICQSTELHVLDLSYNRLSSRIPSCLIDMNVVLGVLNLGNNNLSGNIPEIFPRYCSLQTLDLHGNLLEGEVPKSLARCSMLEVLNLGKNLINDTFPCFLKDCTNLQVLSLRYNRLHGDILCIEAARVWPKLQIIDLASNYFTGHVARNFFNWRAMIAEEDGEQMKGRDLRFQGELLNSMAYLDTVKVMNKGLEMELVKILTIFTAIDISNNRFTGEIPVSIGDLSALYVLNMSHNAFTGSIPTSIGKLRQLGSLDLSVNNLAGTIPTELTNLTFLSYLNLSCNRLEGRIPTGSQFLTFTETSFGGNKGLCGSQLNISCSPDEPPPPSEEAEQKGESIVDVVGVEVGFVVGLATFIAPLVLSKRWSRWYYKHAERILVTKVYRYYERRNRERRIPIRRLE